MRIFWKKQQSKEPMVQPRAGLKKALLALLALSVLFFSTSSTSLAKHNPAHYGAGMIANGVTEGRHNLGAYGLHFRADNSDGNGGTTEVCVFCHTPHHGSTNAPLWNKGNQSDGSMYVSVGGTTEAARATSYTAYGTTAGGTYIDSSNCAVTYACLSCHDGVNTFDTLVNAPGKGNDGANNNTATNFNWTFTEYGDETEDHMTPAILRTALIGTNLRDDHPVCEVYNEDVGGLRPSSTIISSISMTTSVLLTNNEGNSATTTSNRWAISGFVSDTASIGDLLKGPQRNIVECSSCHDPHFYNRSWDEVDSTWGRSKKVKNKPGKWKAANAIESGLFLRRIGGNSISGVCRTCHDK